MKKPTKKISASSVSWEQFIKVWESSNSIIEVRTKTGLDYQQVHAKQKRLEKMNVPLKTLLSKRPRLTEEKAKELRELVKRLRK